MPLVWKAFPLEKLRSSDGLVWTVGQTEEIKPAFSNSSGLESVSA